MRIALEAQDWLEVGRQIAKEWTAGLRRRSPRGQGMWRWWRRLYFFLRRFIKDPCGSSSRRTRRCTDT
jgi:hypothetical protein